MSVFNKNKEAEKEVVVADKLQPTTEGNMEEQGYDVAEKIRVSAARPAEDLDADYTEAERVMKKSKLYHKNPRIAAQAARDQSKKQVVALEMGYFDNVLHEENDIFAVPQDAYADWFQDVDTDASGRPGADLL